MEVLRSQSLRMNSLQDESSVTKTSSERDDSDFMCPDSGLMTRDCIGVKSSQIMGGTLGDVGSMSLQRGIDLNLKHQTQQVEEEIFLQHQVDHNQRVGEEWASTVDWD
ncbi:hypothetical protein ABVT39_024941 [Epinephelus coioides]